MNNLTPIEFTVLADYATTKTVGGYTFAVYPFQPAHNAAVLKLTALGLLERSGNRARITEAGLALIPDVVMNPPTVAVDWPLCTRGVAWSNPIAVHGRELARRGNGGYE